MHPRQRYRSSFGIALSKHSVLLSMGEASKGAQENKPFTPGRAAQESAVEEARGTSLAFDNSDPRIDKALADSFPASDPPSWTTGREENEEPRTSETAGDHLQSLSDQ